MYYIYQILSSNAKCLTAFTACRFSSLPPFVISSTSGGIPPAAAMTALFSKTVAKFHRARAQHTAARKNFGLRYPLVN